jgi:hypothetical protein
MLRLFNNSRRVNPKRMMFLPSIYRTFAVDPKLFMSNKNLVSFLDRYGLEKITFEGKSLF